MQHEFFADIPKEKTLAASLALQEFLETSAAGTLETRRRFGSETENRLRSVESSVRRIKIETTN